MQYTWITVATLAALLIQLSVCNDACPYVSAPDGSQYDISGIANQISQFSQLMNGQEYNFTVSICSTSSTPCGACSSAGVCMSWGPTLQSTRCFGSLPTRQVIGLNNGAGVQIIYQGGEPCGTCVPSGPRTSIVTLSCDPSISNPNQINWKGAQGANPGQEPILHVNGSISCSPEGTSPSNQVTIEYHGYGSSCNISDAFLVIVDRTRQCTPGCQKFGAKYILTDCSGSVVLPSGDSWIKQISYVEQSCATPSTAVFKRPNLCTGSFNYSYQTCDANTVYTYACNSPYCNQCDLYSKTTTNSCANGTEYMCVIDKKGEISKL
jgi:hypothetical protein